MGKKIARNFLDTFEIYFWDHVSLHFRQFIKIVIKFHPLIIYPIFIHEEQLKTWGRSRVKVWIWPHKIISCVGRWNLMWRSWWHRWNDCGHRRWCLKWSETCSCRRTICTWNRWVAAIASWGVGVSWKLIWRHQKSRVIIWGHQICWIWLSIWVACGHQAMEVKFVCVSFSMNLRHDGLIVIISVNKRKVEKSWLENVTLINDFLSFLLTSMHDSICRNSCYFCSFWCPNVLQLHLDRWAWIHQPFLYEMMKKQWRQI